MEQWGSDEIALQRRAFRFAEFQAAAQVLRVLGARRENDGNSSAPALVGERRKRTTSAAFYFVIAGLDPAIHAVGPLARPRYL